MKQRYDQRSDPNRIPLETSRRLENQTSSHTGGNTLSSHVSAEAQFSHGASDLIASTPATSTKTPTPITSSSSNTTITPEAALDSMKLDQDIARGLQDVEKTKTSAHERHSALEAAKAAFRTAAEQGQQFLSNLSAARGRLSTTEVAQLRTDWDKASNAANTFLGQLITTHDTVNKDAQEGSKMLKYAQGVRDYAVQNRDWFEQARSLNEENAKRIEVLRAEKKAREQQTAKHIDVPESEKNAMKQEYAKQVEALQNEKKALHQEHAHRIARMQTEKKDLEQDNAKRIDVMQVEKRAQEQANWELQTENRSLGERVRQLTQQKEEWRDKEVDLGWKIEDLKEELARIEKENRIMGWGKDVSDSKQVRKLAQRCEDLKNDAKAWEKRGIDFEESAEILQKEVSRKEEVLQKVYRDLHALRARPTNEFVDKLRLNQAQQMEHSKQQDAHMAALEKELADAKWEAHEGRRLVSEREGEIVELARGLVKARAGDKRKIQDEEKEDDDHAEKRSRRERRTEYSTSSRSVPDAITRNLQQAEGTLATRANREEATPRRELIGEDGAFQIRGRAPANWERRRDATRRKE